MSRIFATLYLPTTLFKIIRASPTLSATAAITRGLGVSMLSRASRTAAMIAAQIATVLAYRALCSFSHMILRFISPTSGSIGEEKTKNSHKSSRFSTGRFPQVLH